MNRSLFTVMLYMLIISISFGQSVVNTVHNLSASGPGSVKAVSESEICIFCHTPHSSSSLKPLWNKNSSGVFYTLYSSSSLQSTPGQPNGSSVLCLSCHDGTVALGDVISRSTVIDFNSGITYLPPGTSELGSDLHDDHPISFLYNSTVSANDGELADPASLNSVGLEDEYLQCVSCHDPHNNDFGDFLVMSNSHSALCTTCHTKTGWESSSHSLSSATWNGSGDNPWFHTDYTSVAENGCENCHTPHNSESSSKIMNYAQEENNCLVCHNGNVASTDIQSQINKSYSHDVFAYQSIHDTEENSLVQTIHVECEDCHNPHEVNNNSASAPNASGYISGVKGVDNSGNPVTRISYQYELCYRCHTETSGMPGSPTTRLMEQNNVRLEFASTNPSFHPIEAAGASSNVPSLISPYTESSIIYCTDCHADDGSSSPAGPHGSIYPHILKYNYQTTDGTVESAQNYELCYSCHDRDIILDTSTNFGYRVHYVHIVEENTPCNVCHDPHGVNGSQVVNGTGTRLINFDLSVVNPNRDGELYFSDGNDDVDFSGSCYLECHGQQHRPKTYFAW